MQAVDSVLLFIAAMLFSSIQITTQVTNDIDTTIGCRLRLPGRNCDSKDVRFILFDSYGTTNGIQLNVNKPFVGSKFNPHKPLKVICHGFEGGIQTFNPTYLIKEAYLKQEKYNVIIVDWSRLSTMPCYNVALMNTKFVGECIGQLLVSLERSYPTFKAREAHVIGFSMGCHVAAETSRTLQRLTGNQLARVTGLDPRQSRIYRTLGFTWFIEPSCADQVDVIYTNGGDQGRQEMMGSVEFYVNGGSSQKQCTQGLVQGLCSHLSAPVYYAETITSSTGFYGVRCPGLAQFQAGDCPDNQTERVQMGQPCCTPGTTGRYYVTTDSTTTEITLANELNSVVTPPI